MIPKTLRNKNLYKGPSTSSEFNELRTEMHEDITSLFSIGNKNEELIQKNMDVLIRENFFIQNRIEKLERKIHELEAEKASSEAGESSKLLRSFYHTEGLSDGDTNKQVNLDITRGIVSPLETKNESKLAYLADNGQFIIPKSLEVNVYESNNTQELDESGNRVYYGINQNDIKNAIDSDKNTYWVNTSQFDKSSGVTEVYGMIHIKLPNDISNNMYVNTLLLNPCPEYSMSLLDIHYKGQGEQWNRLENYPVERDKENKTTPKTIDECAKIILSFPRVEMSEIKIMFKQPYWFEHNNSRFFIYGFQDIKLEYREHSTKESEFVSKFSLLGTDRRFYTVEEPVYKTPDGCPQDIEECVSYKIYYDKNLSEEFPFGHQISAPVQEVYIKTIIKKVGETVPFIKQMELRYNHKDLDE